MINAEISLDPEGFDHKPSRDLQYKDYVNKLGRAKSEVMVLGSRVGIHVDTVTPTSLSRAIMKGQTWSPFTFKKCPDWKRPRRIEPLFKSCQVLAVDFDKGQSVEEIEKEASALGITFNIIHHSFSSSPECPKLRGIAFLESACVDFERVKRYNIALAQSFSEADTQCIDVARLYFGSVANSVVKLNTSASLSLAAVDNLVKLCKADSFLVKTKLNELKPEESEWGDSATQRKILNSLTPAKRKYVKTKVLGILKDIETYSGGKSSRYECVWRGSSRLARMPELVGSAVYEWVTEAVGKNPHFANWDKSTHEVVMSAIQWSSSHSDEAL